MSEYDYVDDPMMSEPAPEEIADAEMAEMPSLEDHVPPVPPTPQMALEDLTLAQALGLLIFRPVRAGQELWRTIAPMPRTAAPLKPRVSPQEMPITTQDVIGYVPIPDEEEWQPPYQTDASFLDVQERNWLRTLWTWSGLEREQLLLTGVLGLAIVFALIGADILRDAAVDEQMRADSDTGGSIFWFVLSAITYLSYALYQGRDWWRARFYRPIDHNVAASEPELDEPIQRSLFDAIDMAAEDATTTATMPLDKRLFLWIEQHFAQLTLVPIALLMSYLAYARNIATDAEGNVTGIVFTSFGFTMWVLALVTWSVLFSIDINKALQQVLHWRHHPPKMPAVQTRWRWTHFIMLIIVLVAAYFRLNMLDDVPPDMTSDHIEKLLDAVRVHDGIYAVFFSNNGGREAFQMYAVAAIADWFDVGFNFRALKYATVIEGMLAVILSFWVAKEVIGRDTPERRQLGDWVGLGTAALMAVSFWHVMLSRLGLRIVLTPLTVVILTYFLVRGIRYNRRSDFVWIGLILGLSTYFYQANRMLPILVVAGVVLAMIFNAKLKLAPMTRYAANLAVAGIIAFVAYLPMYHYSQVYELEFWNRTYGRIFGEDEFRCFDEVTGDQVLCRPSFSELLDLLQKRQYGPDADRTAYDAFLHNYVGVFISFMYEGERQWITNVGGNPALDATTAGLYMLGYLMWVVMAINRRDVALLLVPIGIFVMVLPSALAIAPNLKENPSFTRMSGTALYVFMMAALPLAIFALQIAKMGREKLPYYAVSMLLMLWVVRGIGFSNFDVFFNDYRANYAYSWRPYSDIAEPLVEYVDEGGSYGNAFYVNYPHWLDHRILGAVAGDMTWPNGLFEATDVYSKMMQNQNTPYAYDPTRPLLFYIHPKDTDDIAFLQQRFPNGQLRYIDILDDTSFYTYEVPAGLDWLAYALTTETIQQGCIVNCLPGPK